MKFLIAFLSALLLSTSVMSDVVYKATMKASNEVPPVQSLVNGEFLFRDFDNRWFIAARGGLRDDKIVAITLRCGRANANGPMIYNFYFGLPNRRIFPKGQFNDTKIIPNNLPTTVCPVTIQNITQLKGAIISNLIYVNVHTQKNPNGAARGQVFRVVE